MIIEELNLISFGKFKNKKFKLEDELNILYGENEAGKTTIHNFIDGMFYGFLKPYVTRRYYIEEYEKYRPWNGEQYCGILKFSKEDKLYRIERDFAKGEVKVYDDLTGRNITKDIDTGEKVKVHLPGIYFFDFNNTVYKNTISIKQLGNKIDSSLSNEVKDRLANISTSLDDDISVKNAIIDLDKQIGDIGTERAYTSPYGRSKIKLDKLKDKREKTLGKQEEYNKYIDESFSLKEKIEKEKLKINKLQIKLKKVKILEKKKIHDEGLKIKKELNSIDIEIEKLKTYSKLSFNDYMLASKLDGDNEHLDKEIQELEERLKLIEQKLNNIKMETDEGIVKGINAQELYDDMGTFDEREDEKNNYILNSKQSSLDILNSELRAKVDKQEKFKIYMIILILSIIGSLGLGFINIIIFLVAIPLCVAFIYIRSVGRKSNKEIDALKQEIGKISKEQNKNNERIIYIENYQKDILLKYNCSSKLELKRLHDDIYLNHMNQVDKVNKTRELDQQREQLLSTLKLKQNEIKKIRDEKNTVIFKNNSNTLEEFKEGLEKKKIYDNLIKDKDNKSEILRKTLGDIKLEELKIQLIDCDDEYFEDIKGLEKDKIVDEIKDKEEILMIMGESNVRLEERIDNLNKEVKQLVLIEEEIDRIENLIESYENRIKSIEIAKETIENISKEIHNQFAPQINKEVSQMIRVVTDGKYDKVKINDNLDIAVENPITKEIIDIDSLSGGTIDQLYFALRFSIISSMKGKELPLILDDCFIQYDDERLNNVLGFLSEISEGKQILLFTCHNREKQILDNLGLKYNLINLA